MPRRPDLSGTKATATALTGADLRRWREAAGLSRRALAEAAHCSASYIDLLERSATLPARSFILPSLLAALDKEIAA